MSYLTNVAPSSAFDQGLLLGQTEAIHVPETSVQTVGFNLFDLSADDTATNSIQSTKDTH